MAATNPILNQAGVIAYRVLDGKVQVLLMTSRDTGRWIIPKGNINGRSIPSKAAEKGGLRGSWGQGNHHQLDPAGDLHLFQEIGVGRGAGGDGRSLSPS